MVHIEHRNKSGIHNFYIWDHTGWVTSILPTSDFKKGKYDAYQIALRRQGKLKIEEGFCYEIRQNN